MACPSADHPIDIMTAPKQLPDLLPAAELYLCLSRALLAPQAGVTLAELQGPLLQDLRSLADELPTLKAEHLDDLARALDALTSDEQLMLGYSRLFLTPPAPTPLNLGVYLDSALMGQSTQSILALYRRHGLEHDPAFRDLPDHLSLNLQWFAWVYSELMEARDTGEDTTPAVADAVNMMSRFTLPALTSMRSKLAQSTPGEMPARPWGLLIDLIHAALEHDRARLEAILPALAPAAVQQPGQNSTPGAPVTFEASEAPREQLTCRSCGETFESDPVMAEMRQRLAAAGVSAEHMSVCPRCQGRDSASPSLKPPGAGLKAWQ